MVVRVASGFLLAVALQAFGDTNTWQLTVFGGYHSWNALADLQPDAPGHFDSGGWNFGGVAHRVVRRSASGDLAVGVETALFATASSIPGQDEELLARGLYVTPSIEWSRPTAAGSRLNLDAGAGIYLVDFVEIAACDIVCTEIDEVFEETRFGGFVGVGYEFPAYSWGAIVIRLRSHFVDFGNVSQLGSDAGQLDGPIFMFQLGARLGR